MIHGHRDVYVEREPNLKSHWFSRSENEVNNSGGQEANHSADESAILFEKEPNEETIITSELKDGKQIPFFRFCIASQAPGFLFGFRKAE